MRWNSAVGILVFSWKAADLTRLPGDSRCGCWTWVGGQASGLPEAKVACCVDQICQLIHHNNREDER